MFERQTDSHRERTRKRALLINWIAAVLDSTTFLSCSLFPSLVVLIVLHFCFLPTGKIPAFRDCTTNDRSDLIIVALLVIDDYLVVVCSTVFAVVDGGDGNKAPMLFGGDSYGTTLRLVGQTKPSKWSNILKQTIEASVSE